MNWSDTPPTVAGDYWVRRIPSGEEQIGTLDGENWYFKWPYEDWFPANNPEQFQFGYRIPTNAELGELLGLIEEYGLRCKAYGSVAVDLGWDLARFRVYEARDGESGEAGHRDYCQHGRERAAMTNWSDTPPTVAGTYWVKFELGDEEAVTLAPDGSWWYADHPKARCDVEGCQFGKRIPSNGELAELPGLIEEYGLRCKAYGLALQSLGSDEQWGLRKMRDEILAKINAILGVAE